jgi:hypothetical protein
MPVLFKRNFVGHEQREIAFQTQAVLDHWQATSRSQCRSLTPFLDNLVVVILLSTAAPSGDCQVLLWN